MERVEKVPEAIEDRFNREHINIMTSCDDNLAKYVLPQIASIAVNLADYHINFYMFHSRISPENINLLREFAESFKMISFNEIVIEDVEPYRVMAERGGGWAYEAYFSLCCHKYLPESVGRILYIDAGDVIINGDISEYYFGDFDSKSIIATSISFKERSGEISVFEKDDMNSIDSLRTIKRGLLNSGSYVINVDQFRADKLGIEDFLYISGILQERFPDEKPVYWGDQGLISVAFAGDMKFFAYPEIKNLWYMPYNFCLWFFDRMGELWYEPKILHYAVQFKPWRARFSVEKLKKYDFLKDFKNIYAPFHMNYKQIEFSEIWWKYCEMTPIYEEINKTAGIYAQALETHFLPLCKKYNDMVNENMILQQKLQSREQKPHVQHTKKKRKK